MTRELIGTRAIRIRPREFNPDSPVRHGFVIDIERETSRAWEATSRINPFGGVQIYLKSKHEIMS